MFEKIKQFLNEVNGELRKVTWPTKQEVIGSTWVVVIVSVVVSVFIGAVDRVLSALVAAIFGGGAGG